MSDKLFRQKAPVVMGDLMAEFPELRPHDAAAVLGNIGGESGGFTIMQEQKPTVAGSRGGYGWCQWTGPRRRTFEAWCKTKRLSVDSDAANFGYLCHELRTSEKRALPAVMAAPTLEKKVIAFERGFERAGIPHYEGRFRWAKLALECYMAANKPQRITEIEPDPDPEPVADPEVATRRPPAEDFDTDPAPIKGPWYKKLWAKISGAGLLGGGLSVGGFTLDAAVIYAVCVLFGVVAVGFLGWVYLIPPRGSIRKGLQ